MIFVLKMLFTFVYDPKNGNHWHYSLLVTHYSTRNTFGIPVLIRTTNQLIRDCIIVCHGIITKTSHKIDITTICKLPLTVHSKQRFKKL